jgi:hypothetical protein
MLYLYNEILYNWLKIKSEPFCPSVLWECVCECVSNAGFKFKFKECLSYVSFKECHISCYLRSKAMLYRCSKVKQTSSLWPNVFY